MMNKKWRSLALFQAASQNQKNENGVHGPPYGGVWKNQKKRAQQTIYKDPDNKVIRLDFKIAIFDMTKEIKDKIEIFIRELKLMKNDQKSLS